LGVSAGGPQEIDALTPIVCSSGARKAVLRELRRYSGRSSDPSPRARPCGVSAPGRTPATRESPVDGYAFDRGQGRLHRRSRGPRPCKRWGTHLIANALASIRDLETPVLLQEFVAGRVAMIAPNDPLDRADPASRVCAVVCHRPAQTGHHAPGSGPPALRRWLSIIK
jgi:hypothetical protein